MTHDAHDITIGVLASVPNWGLAIFAFVTQADIPLWLYALIAIILPVFLVAFGKAIDIGYQEWKAKRGR